MEKTYNAKLVFFFNRRWLEQRIMQHPARYTCLLLVKHRRAGIVYPIVLFPTEGHARVASIGTGLDGRMGP